MTGHDVFFHFELQATVVTSQSSVLSITVLWSHERRCTLLTSYEIASSLFDKFFEHLIFWEEIMNESFTSTDTFLGIFFKQFFHEVEPWINRNLHDSGKLRYSWCSKLNLQALFWAKTSSYYLPGKGDFLRTNKWKMTPTLNRSQAQPYFILVSFRLTISGAT